METRDPRLPQGLRHHEIVAAVEAVADWLSACSVLAAADPSADPADMALLGRVLRCEPYGERVLAVAEHLGRPFRIDRERRLGWLPEAALAPVEHAVREYLRVRADAGRAGLPAPADALSSSLLRRLLGGRPPLPEPPPTAHGQPWYAVVEMPGPHRCAVEGAGADGWVSVNGARWEVREDRGGELLVRWQAQRRLYRLWRENGSWHMRSLEFERAGDDVAALKESVARAEGENAVLRRALADLADAAGAGESAALDAALRKARALLDP